MPTRTESGLFGQLVGRHLPLYINKIDPGIKQYFIELYLKWQITI